MLWRALKHIECGFYIDVGAQDPVIDSVSLAFYEHGWRGVNVEPTSLYAEKIRRARSDETLIQAAVGSNSGVFRFYEIADTGLSTGDPQIAEKHRAAGFCIREIDIPRLTLASILERYVDREIHWLKIDVEGMEFEVLQGWPPSTVRPWIVVIESALPLTQIETRNRWEPLLLDMGYDHVYFDGLNRFYVSKIHTELKDAFLAPPNYFDGFVLSGTSGIFCSLLNSKLDSQREEIRHLSQTLVEREGEAVEAKAMLDRARDELTHQSLSFANKTQELQAEISRLHAHINELNHSSHHWWSVADGLNRELQAVYASRSWRITKLLRAAAHLTRRLRADIRSIPGNIKKGAKAFIRPIFARAIRFTLARPVLKGQAAALLSKHPGLKTRLRNFAAAKGLAIVCKASMSTTSDVDLARMTARARCIYIDLKAAIEKHQMKGR